MPSQKDIVALASQMYIECAPVIAANRGLTPKVAAKKCLEAAEIFLTIAGGGEEQGDGKKAA